MNKYVLWGVGFLLLNGVFAQEGRGIIQKAEQKLRSATTLNVAAQFRLQSTRPLSAPIPTSVSSTILYKKPNKFTVVTKQTGNSAQPTEQRAYSDGKAIWVYFPASKQYIKYPAPTTPVGIATALRQIAQYSPLILLGQEVSKDKGTTFKVVKSSTVNGKNVYIIEARPNKPVTGSDQSTRIVFYVGKRDFLVYKIETIDTIRQRITDASGKPQEVQNKISTVLTFNYLGVNKPIADAKFTFKPPAGTKEIRLPMQAAPATPGGAGPR